MADPQTTPICEECDLPMHPFAADGLSGWACGGCGWSHDDPKDEPPMPTEQKATLPPTALDVLRAYERWEADLILCAEAWATPDGLPRLTQPLYDRLIEIQTLRAEVFKQERANARQPS